MTLTTTLIKPTPSILRPEGSINASNVAEFQAKLSEALEQADSQGLIVDMAGVEFLDSAGLMACVGGLRQAQMLGRRFCLCGMSPSIRMIFELVQLDAVVEILECEEDF